MQGWRNTMEDSHIAKVLDETPGKRSEYQLKECILKHSNWIDIKFQNCESNVASTSAHIVNKETLLHLEPYKLQ
jgi:hypothetical protein